MHNLNVYIWEWSLCSKSIGWVYGTRTIFDIGSSYVGNGIYNFFENFEKLSFIVCNLNQIKQNKTRRILDLWLESQLLLDSKHATLWVESQVAHVSSKKLMLVST